MRCGVTREWISRSLDGRLDKESSATLAEHPAVARVTKDRVPAEVPRRIGTEDSRSGRP